MSQATTGTNGIDVLPTAERREIDALYTPLDEAIEELEKRRLDAKLCARVADYHASQPPTFLPAGPFAALFRHIVTPTHEFDLFAATVHKTSLRPLFLEYQRDRFFAHNDDKYRLCKPAFTVRCNQVRSIRIMDFGHVEGRQLAELRTNGGWTLARWHHALHEQAHPGTAQHIVDCSDWFSTASQAEFYYLRYLGLFICHGILFENFVVHDAEELRFARERVLPSFARATELFGVRPLIVPLLPRENENGNHWRCHPGSLYNCALQLLRAPI